MTVIAWDGKILAADRLGMNGDTKLKVRKIFKIHDGVFGAVSGNLSHGLSVLEWYKNGADPKKFPVPDKEDWCPIVIAATGYPYVIRYERTPNPFRVFNDFVAFGSGDSYAIGAMAAGKNAIEAVKIASKHCISVGLGVDYFRVN